MNLSGMFGGGAVDSRMILDDTCRQVDVEHVSGLGGDRDDLPDSVRLLVYVRGGGVCAYCCRPLVLSMRDPKRHFCMYGKVKSRMFQLDHIIAVVNVGSDSFPNYQGLCARHNGFKFKSDTIDLHTVIQAERFGRKTEKDWRSMLSAWQEAWRRGQLLSALPFHWFVRDTAGNLNLRVPGLTGTEFDRRESWRSELAMYDRSIRKFLDERKWPKLNRLLESQLDAHRESYADLVK